MWISRNAFEWIIQMHLRVARSLVEIWRPVKQRSPGKLFAWFFPALWLGYKWLRILIGSSRCLLLLGLVGVITFILVFRLSFETPPIVETVQKTTNQQAYYACRDVAKLNIIFSIVKDKFSNDKISFHAINYIFIQWIIFSFSIEWRWKWQCLLYRMRTYFIK